MKKKETVEIVQEVIKSGDKVKTLSDLIILTTSVNDKQTGTKIPKDSIAIIDINSYDEDHHAITLTFEDKTTVNLYFKGLDSISRVVRLAGDTI